MLIAKAFQKALNQYLSLDPSTQKQLKAIQDKVIAIHILNPPLVFYFQVQEGMMKVTDMAQDPDVEIKGRLADFLKLKLQSKEGLSFHSSKIQLLGDVELAKTFYEMFSQIDIDWEEQLAQFTGDVFAHQAMRFAKKTKKKAKTFSDRMQKNVTEYVQEEKRLFPSVLEVEDFYNDIHILQNDVDRLAMKIERFINKS